VTGPTAPPPPPPPGPGGYPGDYGAAPQKQQNIFGILSLVLGIVSIVVCCFYAGVWAGIPAIVLGVIGMNKAKRGQASNRGLALTGVILGAIGVVILVGLLAFAGSDTGQCLQDAACDPEAAQACV
jgi:Domain of unknown function (DUF4190)